MSLFDVHYKLMQTWTKEGKPLTSTLVLNQSKAFQLGIVLKWMERLLRDDITCKTHQPH